MVVDARAVAVDLEVAPSECVAVIGPNGAGKSTVVEVLAGLLTPDDGEVVFGDRVVVGRGRPVPAHRRRVGLVAQTPDLFPHLSVVANVAYGPRAGGASRREARLRSVRALTDVGVVALADRTPAELSGGQAQRVAIARALATDPAVLLLDEPTSALDLGARQDVRAAIRRAAVGRPTILVTHDPVEVMTLADRVVVLEGGRVVEVGRPAAVLGRPSSAFATVFSGLAVVRGTATAAGIAPDGGGELPSAAHAVPPGRAVSAAYHPTAARLSRDDDRTTTRDGVGVLRHVEALEPRDGLVRVRAGDLTADLTLARAAALALEPGEPVRIAVPAEDLVVYDPSA
ncbi:ABC transporter ATP-binding protein [Curtobacterium sp. ISL-83]|nr:ABC transporter ATP-binding protein [Curtobacterium sp. ISL-83]